MLAGLKGRETALTWDLKNEQKHNNDHVYNNVNFKYYKNLTWDLKNEQKHNNDHVYNNVNFKYYKNRKNAIALVFV